MYIYIYIFVYIYMYIYMHVCVFVGGSVGGSVCVFYFDVSVKSLFAHTLLVPLTGYMTHFWMSVYTISIQIYQILQGTMVNYMYACWASFARIPWQSICIGCV